MSLHEIENFYLNLSEPNRSCMLSLRDFITPLHKDISQEWKYRLPFFYLRGRMFCYLWMDKKTSYPYIGFTDGEKMNHPCLVQGERKKMKILSINPYKDLPIIVLNEVFEEALHLRAGI